MSDRKKFKFGNCDAEWIPDYGIADAEEAIKANVGNRPEKGGNQARYTQEMVRRRWRFNGETMIYDDKGNLVNGQNRNYALIKAEKWRQKYPAKAKAMGLRGPITIPVLVIRGVKHAFTNTIDQGAGRTNADVLYREGLFDRYKLADGTAEFNKADFKKLARILATTIRTVWMRVGGKDVSDAPKFPITQMEDFLAKHASIVECVVRVYRCDNGVEGLISSYVSLAYMAAVMYLAATSSTDRDDYDEIKHDADAADVINLENMPKAESFVEDFASGINLDGGSPILALKKAFAAQKKSGVSRDRDVVLNMLCKAFSLHLDGTSVAGVKDVQWNPAKESVVRIGGLDQEPEAPEPEVQETPADKPVKSKDDKKKPAKKKAAKKTEPAAPVETVDDEDDFDIDE